VKVGVDFVEQESGLELVDEAEEDGGAHIFGAEGARGHGSEDIEGGGFAATAVG
jgi:hypothetical protein